MAFEQNPYAIKITLIASPGLAWNPTDPYTNKQFRFVSLSPETAVTARDIDDTHWAKPIGVLQNQPKLHGEAEVTVAGVTKVVAGDDIYPGMRIGAGEYGRAVEASSDDADAAWAVGTALTGGVSGDIITIIVNCAVPFKSRKA
jgi:hypothetical protein